MRVPQGFYVYELVDPRDGSAFYVGKGRGDRAWQHEADVRDGCWQNVAKCERIRDILEAGLAVGVGIVQEGMEESAAFALEMERIVAGRGTLTNMVVPRKVPAVCRSRRVTPEDIERALRRVEVRARDLPPGGLIDHMAQMTHVTFTGPMVATPRRALLESAAYLSALVVRLGADETPDSLARALVAILNELNEDGEPELEAVSKAVG